MSAPSHQAIAELLDELSELRKVSALARELLAILGTVEETDDGREFHPTTVQSCRCMTGRRLDEIFTQLKAAVGSNDQAQPPRDSRAS